MAALVLGLLAVSACLPSSGTVTNKVYYRNHKPGKQYWLCVTPTSGNQRCDYVSKTKFDHYDVKDPYP